MLCYCLRIVAAILLGANQLEGAGGTLKLVVIGISIAIFALFAWTLQFSTDLRSYLEVEKFPSRESERDG